MLQENFPNTFRPFGTPEMQTFFSPNGIKLFKGVYKFTQTDNFQRAIGTAFGVTQGSTVNETGQTLTFKQTYSTSNSSGSGSSSSNSFSSSFSNTPTVPNTINLYIFNDLKQFPAFFYSHRNLQLVVAGTTKTTSSNRIVNTFKTYTVQDFASAVTRDIYKRAVGGDATQTNAGDKGYPYVFYQDYYIPVGVLTLSQSNGETSPEWGRFTKFRVNTSSSFQPLFGAFSIPALNGGFQGTGTKTNFVNLNIPERLTINNSTGKTILTQTRQYQYIVYDGNYNWNGNRLFTYMDEGKYFDIVDSKLKEFKTTIQRTTSSPWQVPYAANISIESSFDSGTGDFKTEDRRTIDGNFINQPGDEFVGQNIIEFVLGLRAVYSSAIRNGYLGFDQSLSKDSPIYTKTTYNIEKNIGGSFVPYYPGYHILKDIQGVRAYTTHKRGYDVFSISTTIYGVITTSTSTSVSTVVTNVSQSLDFLNNDFPYYTVRKNTTSTSARTTTVSSATSTFLDTISPIKLSDRAGTFVFKRIDWNGERKSITAVLKLDNPIYGKNRFYDQQAFLQADLTNVFGFTGYFAGYNPIKTIFDENCDYTVELFQGNWNIGTYTCDGRSMKQLNTEDRPILSWASVQRQTFTIGYDRGIFLSHKRLFRPRVVNTLALIGFFRGDPLDGDGGEGFNVLEVATASRNWSIMEEGAERFTPRTTYYVNANS